MKRWSNQSGYVFLLTVVMVSIVVMTSLAMSYIYSSNRLKYHSRIKESYKLMTASESAAKQIKAGWDKAYFDSGSVGPLATQTQLTGNHNTYIADGTAPCSATNIRIENPDDPNHPYCFDYSAQPAVSIGLHENFKWDNFGPLEKFAIKVDNFFEAIPKQNMAHLNEKPNFYAWIFQPKEARADVNIGYSVSNDCASSPSHPNCYQCKEGTGATAMSACVKVTICPYAWASCRLNAGANAITQAFRISTNLDDM